MMKNNKRGRPPHNDKLTPAEWRTVHAAQHGMKNREIAERSHVSINAVKYHLKNAVSKLALTNKRALRFWFAKPKDGLINFQEVTTLETTQLDSISQISRTVKSVNQSESWYRDVLGLTHLYSYDKMSFFDCGGIRLYLNEVHESSPQQNESIIYFKVTNIEQSYQQLASQGVRFTNAPHMIFKHSDGTEEWIAFFEDLEGRPLAISSQANI